MNFIDLLFDLDDKRTAQIKSGKLLDFKKTYLRKLGKENVNTPEFWTDLLVDTPDSIDFMRDERLFYVSERLLKHKGYFLNVGVGKAMLEKKIEYANHDLTSIGVDITLPGLLKARERIKFSPVCATIKQLPFGKECFNVVTVLEVLEHLYYDEIFQALSELRRVLKNNGELIISIPINEKYNHNFNPNGHLRRYSKEIILQELNMASFNVVSIKELIAFRSFYRIKKTISKFPFINKWKPNNLIIVAKKK